MNCHQFYTILDCCIPKQSIKIDLLFKAFFFTFDVTSQSQGEFMVTKLERGNHKLF